MIDGWIRLFTLPMFSQPILQAPHLIGRVLVDAVPGSGPIDRLEAGVHA